MDKSFDFDKADAEAAAATSPAKRDALIRRVREAEAEFNAANPGANVSTEANEDLEVAVERCNVDIQRAGASVHAQHVKAIDAAEAAETRATLDAASTFVDRFERFARFEARRERFDRLCGVTPRLRLDRAEWKLELDAWMVRLERAIAPRPAPSSVVHVPLRDRVKALLVGA